MLRAVACLFAPPLCAACRRCCPTTAVLCERCDAGLAGSGSTLDAPPAGIDRAWAVAPYDGVARELVAALKFRRLLTVAGEMAARIGEAAPQDLLSGTLVPVPPAPGRLLRRGFDPAAEIAAALAGLAGLELRPCLARADGPRQVGRPRTERTAAPPRPQVSAAVPGRVVVVDDVITTGATLSACARALRRAGAERVVAVTFARAV